MGEDDEEVLDENETLDFSLFEAALKLRGKLSKDGGERLFHGFTEGDPSWVVEKYGDTLVLLYFGHDTTPPAARIFEFYQSLFATLKIPLRNVVLKHRNAKDVLRQNGSCWGDSKEPTKSIVEDGVHYALALTEHRDSGFYFDTRNLRAWLKKNSAGKKVLNTFAYTGSLGVAALAGKAARVVQTDRTSSFLEIAKQSTLLNGFSAPKKDFVANDFSRLVAGFRKNEELFDTVIVDAPFFSTSRDTQINLQTTFLNTLNKARPLVAHGGALVAVNNALYLSGKDFEEKVLAPIIASGYATLETRIDVPASCGGEAREKSGVKKASSWPVDPAPYNHPTKMAVLRFTRKDKRAAS